MCSKTACNPITSVCLPELDSQNNAIWGPLTAANFSADFQVIAWSGAGLATYSNSDSLQIMDPAVPAAVADAIYPIDISLFGRQVAADNDSMLSNYSSWVPQVCQSQLARPPGCHYS